MQTQSITEPIVRAAGRLAADLFRTAVPHTEKERYELVSDADRRISRLLIEALRREFPTFGVCSEESEEIEGDGKHRWIIDPLDGTAYFLSGVPYFSVCLSLEVSGKIVEAFVFNPVSDELYYGNADPTTATLNGKPIRCSSVGVIGEAKVGVGFSPNKPKIDRYYADWGDPLDSCQKGIPLIAPALSICSVARGRLDMFIDNGSSMEGHAGAALILVAAGGFVRNYDLTEWDHRTTGIMAANHTLGNTVLAKG